MTDIGAAAGKAGGAIPTPQPTRASWSSRSSLAEALKETATTFFAGKWHLGNEGFWPEDQGLISTKAAIIVVDLIYKNTFPYGNPR